ARRPRDDRAPADRGRRPRRLPPRARHRGRTPRAGGGGNPLLPLGRMDGARRRHRACAGRALGQRRHRRAARHVHRPSGRPPPPPRRPPPPTPPPPRPPPPPPPPRP